jgi:competence protein ComEA
MKDWWKFAIGAVFTLLSVAVIWLVSSQPRGQAITLLPAPTPAPLVVHVAGAVVHPGVYQLPAGSRVQDAIQAAGGLLPEADTQALNLAALLQDGEQISIPFVQPTLPALEAPPRAAPLPTPQAGKLININTATQAELESLPGIGPSLAQQIIAYRKANGPFATIEDIIDVPGIGPKTFEKIKGLITVGS